MKREQLPPAGETNLVSRLLVALVAAVCRFPRTVLSLSLILCVISGVAAATRLQYHTSRNDLMSPLKDYIHPWQPYLKEFPDPEYILSSVKANTRPPLKP